jgi:serine phosphatase RsbU (regulator of sigma subunit)
VLVHERHGPDIFTTLAVLKVAADRRSADVWLAGHPAPVLLHPGAAAELPVDRIHLPLGLEPGRPWRSTTVALPEAWTLLLFTDGLIEGRIGAGSERLGVAGLTAAVDRLAGERPDWPSDPSALLDDLIAHVEELNGGRPADDVAALLVTSRGR